MTVMVESDEGSTHWPPMKKRSACWIGTDTPVAEMVMGLSHHRSRHRRHAVDMTLPGL
jgi:hypothetical protein